jgi:Skp family chaperone for outer membrane proteins
MVTDDPLTARSADVKTLISSVLVPQRFVFGGAILAAVLIAGVAFAQAPHPAGANATKYSVAVVDVTYLFENYGRFRATNEAMKKEMQAIDADVKADREKIVQAEQQRNTYNVGSAEYKKMDEELARMMAEYQLKTQKLQKDFMERQAKVHYQAYLEIVDAINYYAKRQSIGLVLRFNSKPVDPNRKDDIVRDINKHVVMQDQIDITPDVLAVLNRGQSSSPSTPQSGPQAQRTGSQLPPR